MSNAGDKATLLALAARVRVLEEHGGGDSETRDAVAALRAEVEVLSQGVVGITDTLRDLSSRQEAEEFPPILWGDLDDTATAAEESELREWLRTVLLPRFPDSATGLRPCWAMHPQAVEALTQARDTWRMHWGPETTDPDARARWMTDTLPDLMGQVSAAFGSCSTEHHDRVTATGDRLEALLRGRPVSQPVSP